MDPSRTTNAPGLVLLDETQRQQLNLHDQPPVRTRHVLYRPTQSTISSTEEDPVETYSLRRTVPQSRSHARSSAAELTDFTTADQQCGWTPQSRRRQSLESDILTLDEHVQANHAIGKVSGLHLSASHVMIGVAIGFVVGIVLSLHDIPPLVVQWLSMPGELFLRALKALIMPYVFCAVAVGISDMINVGKFSKIGWLTIRVFLTFWLSTAALGVGIAIGFRNLFRFDLGQAKTNHVFGFSCAINNQTLQVQTNGSVLCSSDNTTSTGQYAADFLITDVNNQFHKTDMTGETAHMSISQQLMNIPDMFVPGNVIASFANGELVSVITFAMVLGAVAGKNFHAKTRRINYLYLVSFQLRNAFFALEWVIRLTPGAAISLIAGSFVRNKEFIDHFDRVYMYGVAILVARILHVFVVLPFIVFLATRRNPYKHMRVMAQAYGSAFASSSSLATAPMTLRCLHEAGFSPSSLTNFVVSISLRVSAARSPPPVSSSSSSCPH